MKSLLQLTFIAGFYLSAAPLDARTYYYDNVGRLTQVAYAGGQGIRYEYDDADNLTLQEAITVPKAPSNLNVVRASLTLAELQWQDEDTTENGFSVQRRLARNNDWQTLATLAANTTTYSDSSLSPDENYVYRIVALGVDGDSAYSNASTAAGVASLPFEITFFEWVTDDRISVSFEAVDGETYIVETSSTLAGDSWSTLTFASSVGGPATMSSIQGTSPTTTVYFDVPAGSDRVFYQITRQNN